MSKAAHRIYIATFVLIVLFTLLYLVYEGAGYYGTSIEERFFHPDHKSLKPSGAIGHGLGIIGTLLIIIGVASYMIRKRVKRFRRVGILKYWLEFHIFLCSLGPVMVLFHTAFKFGGIVSVSFWSMVGVVLSGVIGRFIYIQIPRTIEGRELSRSELTSIKMDMQGTLKNQYDLSDNTLSLVLSASTAGGTISGGNVFSNMFSKYFEDRRTVRNVNSILKQNIDNKDERKKIIGLVKNEIALSNRIDRLVTMQNLFKYWHVAHLPFALIMLVIMIVHVVVTITFGYRWIF